MKHFVPSFFTAKHRRVSLYSLLLGGTLGASVLPFLPLLNADATMSWDGHTTQIYDPANDYYDPVLREAIDAANQNIRIECVGDFCRIIRRPEDLSAHWFFDAVDLEGTLATLLQEMGRTPAAMGFFFGTLVALLLLSFGAVVGSRQPVGVVFAFLAYLMGIIFGLMTLSSEYLAVLHFIIYPGAILLFFLFLLLTTSDQWFTPVGEKRYTFGLAPLILLWGGPLFTPLFSLGLLPPQDRLFWRGEAYSLLENSTSLVALGEGVCSEYGVALSVLGLLLLFALLSAMALLNPGYTPRRRESWTLPHPRKRHV